MSSISYGCDLGLSLFDSICSGRPQNSRFGGPKIDRCFPAAGGSDDWPLAKVSDVDVEEALGADSASPGAAVCSQGASGRQG